MGSLTTQHRIDEPTLSSLIEESRDIHADAMTPSRSTLPGLADHVSDRRSKLGPLRSTDLVTQP